MAPWAAHLDEQHMWLYQSGIPWDYHWNIEGTPSDDNWNTISIPSEYHRNASGIPLHHHWAMFAGAQFRPQGAKLEHAGAQP